MESQQVAVHSDIAALNAPPSKDGSGLSSGTKDTIKNLLSGFTAGAICKVGEYPIDTVKVLLQAHSSRYTGPIDCLKQTYARNGMKGLYKGVTTPVVGAMAETSTLFVSYGIAKRLLDVDPNPTLEKPAPMWKYLASGAFSGACTAFVLTPVELIKCNLQVQNVGSSSVKYTGPIGAITTTIRENGFFGLWKGNVSCLFREIPGNIAWFGVYEFIKGRVIQPYFQYETMEDVPLAFTMIAGSLAGVSYWFLPYPADTVKSQIQTKQKYNGKSFTFVMNDIYKNQGIKGLYKGCGITCARAAVSHSFLFYIYEVCYKHLAPLVD